MKPSQPYVHWTEKDEKLCRDLIDAGFSRQHIAALIGRTEKAIRNKMCAPRSIKVHAMHRAAEDLLRARDMRLQIKPRDLTAFLCGDPLPGYSALERRT